jgi:hypothetical protein
MVSHWRKRMRALLKNNGLTPDELILPGKSNTVSIPPEYSKREVLRMLGGSGGKGLSVRLRRQVEDWMERVDMVINPRLRFSVKGVADVSKTGVTLADGTIWRSPKLARAFNSCKRAVVYAGTIGSRIEKEVGKLTERNRLSEAYIVESLGSVAVENMIEQFHSKCGSFLRLGRKGITLPFSPGYCDWQVEEQRKLVSSVAADKIGIRLNTGGLMTPRKSISGVFGVMDRQGPAIAYNPCSNCANRGCAYRRAPQQPTLENLPNHQIHKVPRSWKRKMARRDITSR